VKNNGHGVVLNLKLNKGKIMNGLFIDVYKHQFWADTEHWKTFKNFPSSLMDESIKKRLYHIHLVQNAFLAVVSGDEFNWKKFEDFSDMSELKEYAKSYHEKILVFLKECPDSKLKETVTIPWFRNPQLNLSVEKALLQCAMHSQYHRGQNAARLRELGGEPPLTDFIAWCWKGYPEAKWE
jgi:uncharacterized damage-inducible protein DinB